MNRLTVIGRIVREIELREVGEGKIVLNNVIAVPRKVRTEGGPDADFIPFSVWGKKAELIEEYCNKGDLIGLDGPMQSRKYQNEQDETVYVVEMWVDDFHFLPSKRQESA